MTKIKKKVNVEKWIRIAARSWFVLFSLSFLLILAWLFLTKVTHVNDEMTTEWLVRWNVISWLMFIGAGGAKFIFDLRKNEGSNEEEIKDKMKRRKPNGGIWATLPCFFGEILIVALCITGDQILNVLLCVFFILPTIIAGMFIDKLCTYSLIVYTILIFPLWLLSWLTSETPQLFYVLCLPCCFFFGKLIITCGNMISKYIRVKN